MNIRPVTTADSALLAKLDQETFPSSTFDAGIINNLLAYGATGVLLSDGDAPIGYSLMSASAGSVDLLTIGILPTYRGNGYGRLLLDETINRAKQSGATALYLEVRASNTPAITLYEQAGGVQVGLRKTYYSDPVEDALVMRLELT